MKYLIVVDMQKDFITGSLGSELAEKIVPYVVEKVKNFDGKVIFTRDTHFADYMKTQEGKKLPVEHCIKGTDGWNIPKDILRNNNNVIEKYTFGSVDLFEKLKKINNIESIELIGLCTDICVVSNALLAKANFPNIQITVDSTCCAGVTPESHNKAIDTMKMCQIDIK